MVEGYIFARFMQARHRINNGVEMTLGINSSEPEVAENQNRSLIACLKEDGQHSPYR